MCATVITSLVPLSPYVYIPQSRWRVRHQTHGYLPSRRVLSLLFARHSFRVALRIGGWVGPSGWLHSKTVYLRTVSHLGTRTKTEIDKENKIKQQKWKSKNKFDERKKMPPSFCNTTSSISLFSRLHKKVINPSFHHAPCSPTRLSSFARKIYASAWKQVGNISFQLIQDARSTLEFVHNLRLTSGINWIEFKYRQAKKVGLPGIRAAAIE